MSRSQADQLAVAIGSPIAPHEHENRRRIEMVGEVPRMTRRIGQREVGRLHCSSSIWEAERPRLFWDPTNPEEGPPNGALDVSSEGVALVGVT